MHFLLLKAKAQDEVTCKNLQTKLLNLLLFQCPAPCTFLFCSFCVLSDLGGKTFLINLTWIPSCQTYHWFLFRFTSAEREKLSELKWEAPLCWYFCLPPEQNGTRSFCLQSQLSCNVRHWSAVSCRTGLFFFWVNYLLLVGNKTSQNLFF